MVFMSTFLHPKDMSTSKIFLRGFLLKSSMTFEFMYFSLRRPGGSQSYLRTSFNLYSGPLSHNFTFSLPSHGTEGFLYSYFVRSIVCNIIWFVVGT